MDTKEKVFEFLSTINDEGLRSLVYGTDADLMMKLTDTCCEGFVPDAARRAEVYPYIAQEAYERMVAYRDSCIDNAY